MTKRQQRKIARPVCPICARLQPDRPLPLTIPFGIPTYWSSETAFALFDFIDEMRTIILAAYQTQIQDQAQRHQQSPILERDFIPDDEIPF
jgi:hypothetical protein